MENTHAAWEFDQAVNAFNIGLISKEDLEKLSCDLEPLMHKEWSAQALLDSINYSIAIV